MCVGLAFPLWRKAIPRGGDSMERLRLIGATAAFFLLLLLFWPIAVILLVIDSTFGDDEGSNYYHRL